MAIINKEKEKSAGGAEDVLDKFDLDYDDIITQVKEEIRLSREYVKDKRVEWRSRFRLYNNQRKQKDKIGDTSIFNVMSTMLAVYYSDELQVSFKGREIGDTTQAANIENTAKFDYDEMEMDVLNYLVQWDRLFFGVGIRQISEWNDATKTPIPKSLSALCWLPDPSGGMDMRFFRWSGFEVNYNRGELEANDCFFNLDLLPKQNAKEGSEKELDRQAYTEAQGLNRTTDQSTGNQDTESYDMVDHFTILRGSDGVRRKYLVTVDDSVTNLFRCEEIMPVTKKEKDDPSLVPFPLTLNYYMPSREDPMGTSVPDLIEDKQRAKSIIKNLRISAQKAGLYPMYLYNRDKILNRRDLDFAFNKFVAVRGDVNNGVLMPFNKAPLGLGESLNNEQALDSDIEIATGSSRNSSGVLSEEQRTLGEQEITQANANLRYILGSKINSWGEKRFWKLWYRLYQQNFAGTAKKIIRIQSALGSQFSQITRKTFITNQDPDIAIKSRMESEQKRNMDRMAFTAIAPLYINDPMLPASSRNFSRRYLLQLQPLPQEIIAIMVPDGPDETTAKMENELLSKDNTEPEVEMDQDHLSHIVIHLQAEKTAATMAHIQAHRIAYQQSGQAEKDKALQEAYMANGSDRNSQLNQITGANNRLAGNINKSRGIQPAP